MIPVPHVAAKIRVLIADDSGVVRMILRSILEAHPRFEIAATAIDGVDAVAAFERTRPDLVLLDIEMPRMDGLQALTRIRQMAPRVPVIMCSSLTQRGARITLEALNRGATDYVPKPTLQEGARKTLEQQLVSRILALFQETPAAIDPPRTSVALQPSVPAAPPRLVVIGVSTGGPPALEAILSKLSPGFPVPILIVQHMPLIFTRQLTQRLNGICSLPVREPKEGERADNGVVYIAPGDWHLELKRDFRMRLHQKPPENFCRPSVDVLFRSSVAVCAHRMLGVVLTGMGSDGLEGCRAIRAAGGSVFVQDRLTSVVWGMPGAVANAGLASRILPLDLLAGEIFSLVSASQPVHAG